jgi:hypothetical protein
MDALEKLYFAEAGELHELFKPIPSSIQKMRSSYLPSEMFDSNAADLENVMGGMGLDVGGLVSSGMIGDSFNLKESNENAFMRMLGMPMSDASELQSGALSTVDPATGRLTSSEADTMYIVETAVLDERQKPLTSRLVLINSNIFSFKNLAEGSTSELSVDEDVLDETLEDTAIEADEDVDEFVSEAAMDQMEAALGNIQQPAEFFKFSYLLFPPIQDARISRCINETEKIVAPAFSSAKGRVINRSKMQQSFLESVIRIRLDRATGTQWQTPAESLETDPIIDFNLGDDEENSITYEEVVNKWGLVEYMVIARLNKMLEILADELAETIYNVYEAQIDGYFEIETDQELDSDRPRSNRSEAVSDCPDAIDVEPPSGFTAEVIALKQAKIIEDAILVFFGGQNSATLDLQSQTQRNSGLRDGHLMGPLLSIIRSISDGIDSRMNEIRRDAQNHCPDPEKKVSDVDTTLGTTVGVGPIDIIAFALGLFTIDEEALLGLLSSEQYENLISSELSYLVDPKNPPKKQKMRESLNILSEQIYSVYQIFLSYLDQST